MIKDVTAALRRISLPALVVFVVVDAAMLAWHVAHGDGGGAEATRWLATSHWSVERDRGIPEEWGYVKLLIASGCLVLVGRRLRAPVVHAWAAVFFIVFLDDWMMVHERGGRILLRLIGSPAEIAGVRAQDVGELVVWAGLAALPLLAVLFLHLRSDARARQVSLALGVLMAALVFFGVVLDQVHSFFFDGVASLGATEDGGELLTISAVAALSVGLLRTARAPGDEASPHRADVTAQQPIDQRRSASAANERTPE
jgi:hypothetical protein